MRETGRGMERGTAMQRKAAEEVVRAGQTDRASEKDTGKRPSARDSEGGKEWSRRGPVEAQREIERKEEQSAKEF